MTSTIDTSFEKTSPLDQTSNVQLFLYYLSFTLVYATLTLIVSMLMMGYEDRTGSLLWNSAEMNLSDKIGLIIFYVLQFPIGLLFGLFTGNYHNGLFAFLINPILIAWTFQKFILKTERRKIKRVLLLNYAMWTLLILTIIIYVLME